MSGHGSIGWGSYMACVCVLLLMRYERKREREVYNLLEISADRWVVLRMVYPWMSNNRHLNNFVEGYLVVCHLEYPRQFDSNVGKTAERGFWSGRKARTILDSLSDAGCSTFWNKQQQQNSLLRLNDARMITSGVNKYWHYQVLMIGLRWQFFVTAILVRKKWITVLHRQGIYALAW